MTAQDVRICFIGDSFVNGTGDETYLGWTGRLCAAARTADIQITCYNLGIRRNTSADILQRWEFECASRLPDICDGRVVLSCGVNDMVMENGFTRVAMEASRSNVRNILQRAATRYKTLMIGPAPVGDADLNSRIKIISTLYAEEAHALGIPFIEVYSQLAGNQSYLQESLENDGYHPRSHGYAAIADVIASSAEWWFRKQRV